MQRWRDQQVHRIWRPRCVRWWTAYVHQADLRGVLRMTWPVSQCTSFWNIKRLVAGIPTRWSCCDQWTCIIQETTAAEHKCKCPVQYIHAGKCAFVNHWERKFRDYFIGCHSMQLFACMGSVPSQSIWDLWWTKWHWDRSFLFFLSVLEFLTHHYRSVSVLQSFIRHWCYIIWATYVVVNWHIYKTTVPQGEKR